MTQEQKSLLGMTASRNAADSQERSKADQVA